jgi:hypothetical protein
VCLNTECFVIQQEKKLAKERALADKADAKKKRKAMADAKKMVAAEERQRKQRRIRERSDENEKIQEMMETVRKHHPNGLSLFAMCQCEVNTYIFNPFIILFVR